MDGLFAPVRARCVSKRERDIFSAPPTYGMGGACAVADGDFYSLFKEPSPPPTPFPLVRCFLDDVFLICEARYGGASWSFI